MAGVDGMHSTTGSDRAPDRSGGASVSRQTWLRELELARWREDRQSKIVGGGHHAAGPGDLASSDDRGIAPSPSSRNFDGAIETNRGRLLVSASEVAAKGSVRWTESSAVAVAQRELFAPGNGGYAAATFGATAPEVLPKNSQLSESYARGQNPLPSLPDWQKQKVHVVAAESNVQVWIRDPQFDRDRGLSLWSKLSASMKSIGKKLIALTINGQSVSGASPRS